MFSSNYDLNGVQKYKFTQDFTSINYKYKKGDIVAEFTGHTFGQERDAYTVYEVEDDVAIIPVTSVDPKEQQGMTEYDCIPETYLKKVNKFLWFYI